MKLNKKINDCYIIYKIKMDETYFSDSSILSLLL